MARSGLWSLMVSTAIEVLFDDWAMLRPAA